MSKAYEIYIDDVQMPVAPSEIRTIINGQNETIQLLDGKEFNLINKPGLTDLEMALRLPDVAAHYAPAWAPQKNFLDLFERLKLDEGSRVFSVMILRSGSGEGLSDGYFEYMTLEDYDIKEDVREGSDLIVTLQLKQFVPLRTKMLKVTEDSQGGTFTAKEIPVGTRPDQPPASVEAVENDTLWLISQKHLGDGERFGEIAALNNISNPNDLKAGQVIRLPQ